MWSYLKSDLEELVSVVREDTGIVLEKIADVNEAKKHSAAVKEAERRMSAEETFTVPLLPTINKVSSAESSAQSTVSADADEPFDSDQTLQVEAFLKSLNIDERTDEISDFLEMYPDTLRFHFEKLVPESVRYEDFWERFFYRCDEKRIDREWADEEERARKARAELVGTVSNFFGVAAKAVASGVASALTEDDAGNPGRSSGLKGIFGPSGRPPFVMNTAVDEDEDEGEELGWDDEDEEEEYDGSSGIISSSLGGSAFYSRDEGEEQIEFKDEALDAVNEQLKQAIEERDQLHETVELQSKEIASLKCASDSSSSQVIEMLRAELKMKETELFTLKRVMESEMMKSTATEEPGVNLAAKVEHLTRILSAKDLQLSEMQDTNSTSTKDFEKTVISLKEENELIRHKLLQVASESTSQLKKVAALDADLETTKAALASSQKEAAILKSELDHTKEMLRLKEAAKSDEDAGSGNKSSATHDTASTGVEVDKPAVVSKVVGSDEDAEEGWGDEWD